jgi:hypothetical protein
MPNAVPYINSKDLLIKKMPQFNKSAEINYYVIEDKDDIYFQNWWNSQQIDEVIDNQRIGEVEVITTKNTL